MEPAHWHKSSLRTKTAYQTAKLHFTQLQKKITFQSKQSQNNLLIASTIKDDYTIKAAADGRVYHILVKQGEMINTINAVAIIGDANNFILELQVDEADITQIKLQQQVFINMDSYKGKTFEATITKIYPILNEKSKSFTVEASFVTPPNKLYPNLTCEANILIQTKKNALTIPRNYLLAGDSVVMKSKKKRKVKVGLKDYQKVEIIQGISITDVIYKPIL
jgi:HlyD family secretion protein